MMPVRIKWRDAFAETRYFRADEDLGEFIHNTIGWLINDNDEYVTLSCSGVEDSSLLHGYHKIPKSVIVEQVELHE